MFTKAIIIALLSLCEKRTHKPHIDMFPIEGQEFHIVTYRDTVRQIFGPDGELIYQLRKK